MPPTFLFLLIPLLLGTVTVLEEGQIGGNADDEIILGEDETLDLTNTVEIVPETIETVGGVEVALTQEVEFIAVNNDVVVLKNIALPTVSVEIPNQAKVSAPASWNGELTTPTTVEVTGTVDPAFVAPTTGILFGSPDVILVFDKAVTIVLEDATGQTAYKTPGSDTWILISGCTGTFENPDDPPDNEECSISNEVDTKILTFHFTEFTGLDPIPPDPPDTPSTPSSGGRGGGSGFIIESDEPKQLIIPAWFDSVREWYREGKISPMEFLNAYEWIIKNFIK